MNKNSELDFGPFSFMHTQLFKDLTEFCAGEESSGVKSIDNVELWNALLDVAANEPKTLGIYYSVVASYVEKCPEFRDVNPENLRNLVEKAGNESLPIKERQDAAIPLIIVIPFVSQPESIHLFDISVSIVEALIKEKNELPLEFLDNFDDLMCDEMQEDILAIFVSHIAELLKGDKLIPTLAATAPLLPDILRYQSGSEFFISEVVGNLKKDDPITQQAALFCLEYLANYFDEGAELAPDVNDLFEILVPLIANGNSATSKRAYRAFQAMIECHLFELPVLQKLLSAFNRFTNDDAIKYFFKLLGEFASPNSHGDDCDCGECHEPEISVIQPVIKFTLEKLNANESTALVKGHCLDLLADLAALDPMFVEDCYKNALSIAVKLVNDEKYEAFGWLSPFFVASIKCFPEQTGSTVQSALPKLFTAVSEKKPMPEKKRSDIAADVAEIVGSGFCESLLSKVSAEAKEMLASSEKRTKQTACAMLISLRHKLVKADSNEAFKAVADMAVTEKTPEDAHLYLHTLCKLMKGLSIDDTNVDPVVASILSGQMGILGGHLPHETTPPEESVFVFLEKYIRRYPAKGAAVCRQLVEWIAVSPFAVISAMLQPINAGLEVFAIKEDTAQQLAKMCADALSKIMFTDVGELIALCETVRRLLAAHPAVVKPVTQYFPKLSETVQLIHAIGEEEDYAFDAIEALPSIAHLVITAYANDKDIDVDEDLLSACVSMMPFSPEVDFVGELLQDLVEMLEDTERFESIVVPTLKMFADLLLMKKNDLEEFDLDPEIIKSMKATLKRICKAKPAIGKQITKDFGSSRAKINRFNALIR